jgi:polyhydroxyalkanoate synthesis regulator phasin
VDYGIIEFLVGIVTIVGFMYKFEKDTREELRSVSNRLANAINGVGEAIIDYLGSRGVLKPEEATYLKSDIKRITSIATNPFTEAERRRLLELVDKDDLTLEEAEELHNLARKFYREYIEKTPDAWKVLYYAAAKHGEVLRKHSKQPGQPPT